MSIVSEDVFEPSEADGLIIKDVHHSNDRVRVVEDVDVLFTAVYVEG